MPAFDPNHDCWIDQQKRDDHGQPPQTIRPVLSGEYREIILKDCKDETFISLEKLFKNLIGKTIKQKLLHTKLVAKVSN